MTSTNDTPEQDVRGDDNPQSKRTIIGVVLVIAALLTVALVVRDRQADEGERKINENIEQLVELLDPDER